jgi:hypothetical protein
MSHDRNIDWVLKDLGFPLPRVCGWRVAVKVWYPEKHSILTADNQYQETDLEVAESEKRNLIAMSISGMVIGIGPLAFKDAAFRGERLCEIGDYIEFDMRNTSLIRYRDVAVRLIPDNAVGIQLEHPSHAKRD